MAEIFNKYILGDMQACYIINDYGRAVLVMLPAGDACDLLSAKNTDAYNYGSLAHIHLSQHNENFYSNCLKISETLDSVKFQNQTVEDNDKYIKIITTEASPDGYGIEHTLLWYKGERGAEVSTQFFNNSGETLTLEYITSASLDGFSPYIEADGGKQVVLHRFKAGWSMEGLLQSQSVTELGLEKAWEVSGENLKFGAIGSRPVREYHPLAAVEDTQNNTVWGMSLAHNSSWQMEFTRSFTNLSLSCGLADIYHGTWSKKIADGEHFKAPSAYITVAKGSVAEACNRLLSLRHRRLDTSGKDQNMDITFNEWATTWGNPTEDFLVSLADILKQGKTKYLVADAGWYLDNHAIGDWVPDEQKFPNGLKHYTDEIRKRGLIPGIWFEFESIQEGADHFAPEYDDLMLKRSGHAIIGKVINGRREKFWDFRKQGAIDFLDEKVIKFLRDNGFGYIKVDFNASAGPLIDGDDSPGENLRDQMEKVRDYFVKMGKEIPDLVVENCASGGCRLEQSMMDVSQMSSGSDAHEGYEGVVIGANLHYVAPPRQTQLWCTLKPEYDDAHFSHIISGGFLGRLCWSGAIPSLDQARIDEMFRAEDLYAEVSDIIKKGDSYIYRTDCCSFSDPTGTQAVIRYAESGDKALVVAHSFKYSKTLEFEIPEGYRIENSLYNSWAEIKDGKLILKPNCDFEGNVYLLKK